ncbi:hypothetical protein [Mycobacterium sp. NPDC050853]|uniref:hypothetical protein n=1 Tax=Mycobacterium sp. NPDC050853 TaxID=3155160 RepID=UPI0033D9FFC1
MSVTSQMWHFIIGEVTLAVSAALRHIHTRRTGLAEIRHRGTLAASPPWETGDG